MITQQIIRSENLPGKGYVDFETIFAKLKAANNNSPFSVEIEFTQAGPRYRQELCANWFADSGRMKSAGNRDIFKSRL